MPILDPPFLDHVGLAAAPAQIEKLGFHLTPTSGVAAHARIFFERSYFEVTPPAETGDGLLGAKGWFLRTADPGKAAEVLRGDGISVIGPRRYEGGDGIWLDVTIEHGNPALPILTRRLDKPADVWPPPEASNHANDVTRLSAVHLEAKDPAHVAHILETIGARAGRSGTFELGSGSRVVVQESRDGREGLIALELDRSDQPPLTLEVSPV
ncbi:MAG: VOC family protein [Chthoniobacterales bacterium]|nr:VOC family protein [Chthoniobacterales bacterium]